MKYIKSPLNYTGGKYKLLNDILPLFPNDIRTFVDLFGGGFNMGINVDSKFVIYNDIESHIVELMKYLYAHDTNDLLCEIQCIIDKYSLSKTNAEGFNALRDYYNNENQSPIVFYTMICYAFNNQIRFNKNSEYNMPFGKNRSSFNPALKDKFIIFVNELHNKNCKFTNYSFNEFDFSNLNQSDFVYCDPPYYNSTATYNENGGWTEKDEINLLCTLDELNSKNIMFALSNNLKYGNDILNEWMCKYTVHYLNANYTNCNYHKINKDKDIEVLITNY